MIGTKYFQENLKNLLAYGYFPEELPPFFHTESFAHFALNNLTALTQGKPAITSCANHNIPKKLSIIRRHLKIPNPKSQLLLCYSIAENWSNIKYHLRKSKLSVTLKKPFKIDNDDRALKRTTIKQVIHNEILSATSSRHILRADISRYYSTLYTHIIPWALHTKAESKSKKKDLTLYGNKLDTLIRNTQDSQTMGIPIGADTSLILAEIVGTAIDQRIQQEIKNVNGFRYVDDFTFFVSDAGKANELLYTIQRILQDFELELNPEKSYLSELPLKFQTEWISDLNTFHFDNPSKHATTEKLKSYFGKAFELSRKYPHQHILKYAISRIKEKDFSTHWDLYESLLLQCFLVEPSTSKLGFDIIYAHHIKHSNNLVNIKKISRSINFLVEYLAKLRYNNELCWILWAAKIFNIKLSSESQEALSYTEDPFLIILGMDLYYGGLLNKKFQFNTISNFINLKTYLLCSMINIGFQYMSFLLKVGVQPI